MFSQFKKDLKIGGIINICIYIFLNIYIQIYLQTKSSAFHGFETIHYIIWYTSIFLQNIYILFILFDPKKNKSNMSKSIYNFFTIGGFKSLQDILIETELNPFMEYLILFLFILIPWPILKNISLKHRLLLIFAKIGIFHFITSILLINWKTKNVNYKFNLLNNIKV